MNKRKVDETIWSVQVVQKIKLDPNITKLLRDYFPSDMDINELTHVVSEYIHKKDKKENRPEQSQVRECLLKLADVFDSLPTASYTLTELKMKLNDGKVKKAINDIIFELDNNEALKGAPHIISNAAREAAGEIPEHIPKGGSIPSYPERGLIVDIADLYEQIHGEYPLRVSKAAEASGPLDEIINILDGVLDCGTLQKLIRNYDTFLRKK